MKSVKKLQGMFFALVLAMVVLIPVAVRASEISVTIDGLIVDFEGQPPVIVESRTLVPVRGVFEMLDFYVSWDNDTRAAILTRSDYTVIIAIDSYIFTTNGVNYSLDVPAQIIGGRTMLPIRAVLESVGYSLDWDGANNTVLISRANRIVEAVTPPGGHVEIPEPTASPISSEHLTFNSTFTFRGMEITFRHGYRFEILDSPFNVRHGATLIAVPVTVRNVSSESRGLSEFDITVFNPQGTQQPRTVTYRDDDVTWRGNIRPNATLNGYVYFLYEGAGEYWIELFVLSGRDIEVKLPIANPGGNLPAQATGDTSIFTQQEIDFVNLAIEFRDLVNETIADALFEYNMRNFDVGIAMLQELRRMVVSLRNSPSPSGNVAILRPYLNQYYDAIIDKIDAYIRYGTTRNAADAINALNILADAEGHFSEFLQVALDISDGLRGATNEPNSQVVPTPPVLQQTPAITQTLGDCHMCNNTRICFFCRGSGVFMNNPCAICEGRSYCIYCAE